MSTQYHLGIKSNLRCNKIIILLNHDTTKVSSYSYLHEQRTISDEPLKLKDVACSKVVQNCGQVNMSQGRVYTVMFHRFKYIITYSPLDL